MVKFLLRCGATVRSTQVGCACSWVYVGLTFAYRHSASVLHHVNQLMPWQGNLLACMVEHTTSTTPGRLAVLETLLKGGAKPQDQVSLLLLTFFCTAPATGF